MSETLKISGEKSAENTEASGLEVLTGMKNDFNPDRAKSRAETDGAKSAEKPSTERGRSEAVEKARAEVLATLPGEREKELSPEDAANEYLSLLDELSQDFSNPHYGNSKMPTSTGVGFARELGRKYSDDPNYRWLGYAGTEADPDARTMFRIGMADFILQNEIGWREITDERVEASREKRNQIDKELADLDAEYSRKGALGKFLGKRKYEQRRVELNRKKGRPLGQDENTNIARGLAYIYDDEGKRNFNDLINYQVVDNEALNRRFFGLDDPERAEKVERAIELRQKYANKWTQDKTRKDNGRQGEA